MSINWVMLPPAGPRTSILPFVPLTNESIITSSPPRIELTLETARRKLSATGTLHLTNQRIIFLSSTPSAPSLDNPNKTLDSFATPLTGLLGSTLKQPWFGPNTWAAAGRPVQGGGLESEWVVECRFLEGGAVEWTESVKRAEESAKAEGELPRYEEPAGGVERRAETVEEERERERRREVEEDDDAPPGYEPPAYEEVVGGGR